MRFAINRDAMVHERAGAVWRAPRGDDAKEGFPELGSPSQ